MKESYSGPISLSTIPASPFWLVSFRAPDGSQRKRSTKVPVKGGMFMGEMLSAAQAKKRALLVGYSIAAEVREEHSQHDNTTVRALCDIMLQGKLGHVSVETYDNARTTYEQFCKWLGYAATQPARLITKAKMKEWVIYRRAQVRHATTRKDLSVISAAFAWAVDSEIMPANPCLGLKIAPDTKDEKVVHEASTLEEIQLLLNHSPEEWASAVRCCIGTFGQRLNDVLGLKWEQFDWKARIVRIVTGKTGASLMQPMTADFYAWAKKRHKEALEKGGDAAIWVHPRLHSKKNASGEFTQLVRLHGIGLVGQEAGGNRRTWHSKTFHSLRASVATMLHAGGLSLGLAMRLVGHESESVHKVYIRPSAEQLAEAAKVMPRL